MCLDVWVCLWQPVLGLEGPWEGEPLRRDHPPTSHVIQPLTGTEEGHAVIMNVAGVKHAGLGPQHTQVHTPVNTNTRGGVGRKLWCMAARFRAQV